MTCYGQTETYPDWIVRAEQSFAAKDFPQAAAEYHRAFQVFGGKGYAQDRYQAAMAWALSGVRDSAFFDLFRLADKTDFLESHKLETEANFASLHHDARWQTLLSRLNPNQEVYRDSLAALLTTVHDDDQRYRQLIEDTRIRYGANSREYQDLMDHMILQDSLNLVLVTRIIDRYGWLSVNEVGAEGNAALWLVIQHAELPVQEKYFPILRTAVTNQKASKRQLAYLEDRILMRQGKKQLYGTQYKLDPESGNMTLWDVEDPDGLDERRAAMGLPPFQG